MTQVAVVDASVVEVMARLLPVLNDTLINLGSENERLKSGMKLWSADELGVMWGMEGQTVRKYLKGFGVNPVVFSDRRSTRYRDADVKKLIEAMVEKPSKKK